MKKRFPQLILIAVPLLCLLSIGVYFLPPVHERLAWRVDNLRAQVRYWLNPPEQVVFVPQGAITPTPEQTPRTPSNTSTLPPSSTPTLTPSDTATPAPTSRGPTATTTRTHTITPSATPIPPAVRLKGVVHEYQKWNNCGTATLSLELSFWGWKGTQLDIAAVVKPNGRDKNVMPYEMETYIDTYTDWRAIVRVGGNLELVKQFLAAGFTVMVEKGFEPDDSHGWMGHYEVITGYDEAKQSFWVYDSYLGQGTDFLIPYQEVITYWINFNYIYLVIYPLDREAEVLGLLGPDADETTNYQNAAQIASNDIFSLTGAAQFYAWYNRGTNLMRLQDYAGAAAAYDEAFAIYPTIPEKNRPWRMLWYQTGPYFAYFYTGRYYDVLSLATQTIENTEEPAIEETWYWRALARNALGDVDGAIEDLRQSLEWHPDFGPSLDLLAQLGATP